MTLPRRLLFTVLIAAALAGLALVLTRREETAPTPRHATSVPPKVASMSHVEPPPSPAVRETAASPPPIRAEAPLRPPPLALNAGPLAWEQKLAGATALERDATGSARALLALLPTLPEEALATTAQQAIERLPDTGYAAIALPVVTDPKTHGQVMSVLFADLMERPDAIALPALLAIARNPAHPFSSAALDNLRLLLGADSGTDWTKWNEAIRRRLEQVPPAPGAP